MSIDQIINNLHHAKPKVYTMAVAQALRSAEKKLGEPTATGILGTPVLARAELQPIVEAIVEGVVYSLVPLIAATIAEMQAADGEITPPVEDNARNPDGTPGGYNPA